VVERVELKYLRWVLGVDRKTPDYIVREDTESERKEAEFDKIDGREECRILTECWREMTGWLGGRMAVGESRYASGFESHRRGRIF
jgi:hypothetical protein